MFQSGTGKLVSAKQIVATLTQALTLFGKKVIQENLNFVRFQNHRMFFVDSQNSDLVAVRMVDKSLLTKQFVPAMSSTLRLVESLVAYPDAVDDNSALVDSYQREISTLFEILSEPEKTLFVVPRTTDGFISLLILFSGLFFDMAKRIEPILENLVLLKEGEVLKTSDYPQKQILNIGVVEDIIMQDGFPKKVFNIGIPQTIPIFDRSQSLAFQACTIFGFKSNAYRILEQEVSGKEVDEVVQSILELPRSTDKLLIEAIKEAVETSGRNIAKMLYRKLLEKMKEIESEQKSQTEPVSSSSEITGEPELEVESSPEAAIEPESISLQSSMNALNDSAPAAEVEEQKPLSTGFSAPEIEKQDEEITEPTPDALSDDITAFNKVLDDSKDAFAESPLFSSESSEPAPDVAVEPGPVSEPLPESALEPIKDTKSDITLSERPAKPEIAGLDALNADVSQEVTSPSETSEVQPVSTTDNKILSELPQDLESNPNKILMETIPILVDVDPYLSGNPPEEPTFAPSLQLSKNDSTVQFSIKVHPNRLENYMNNLDDLKDRLNATVTEENGKLTISCMKNHLASAMRGITWSLIIEYAYEIQSHFIEPIEGSIFKVSNEGSVCIIPGGVNDKRRKQLPKQIQTIIEEDVLFNELGDKGGKNPASFVLAIDQVLKGIHRILKFGVGVGYVPRKGSEELPEITEFLLLLSEKTGIGWSRW